MTTSDLIVQGRSRRLASRLLRQPGAFARRMAGAEVRNVDPWHAAFDVKPGQALHLPPERRLRIW